MGKFSRVSLTAVSETLGIALAAIAGFFIVHALPKEMYARYSFIAVCITFLVGLSDAGLSHCYLPLVSDRAADEPWVLAACRRIYRLRWRALLPASVVVLVYWSIAAAKHGWTDGQFFEASALAALAVLLAVREQSCRSLLIVLRQVSQVNQITLISNCVRVVLVAAVVTLMPTQYWLVCLLIATGLGSVAALVSLRGVDQIRRFANAALVPAEQVVIDQRVHNLVRPLLLPMTFYQVQGLLTVFLVSLFGLTNSIAEVTALSRPTLVIAILDRVLSVVLFPAIASVTEGRRLHLLVLRSQAAYFAAMLVIFASSCLRPDLWILLIGERYRPQQGLLWMAFLSAILMYSAGFALATLTSRGKTSGQSLLIPIVLSVQGILLITVGVGDTRAALIFSICTSASFFLFQYSLLFSRWLRTRRSSPIAPV
jgi:hypothetical protein